MEKEILTLEEAAGLFDVSVKTFIKLLREEKIPARKIGREWRFSREALIRWLSEGNSQSYSGSEAETREFFDKVAPIWEEMRKGYYNESVKNKIMELEIFEKAMTVVDLGCGDGFLSRAIAGYVNKVVAVDISGEMLKELKDKAESEGIRNITALESDGRDVPLGDSSADIVLANMYLHHIEEPETAIGEMHRLLKPGGTAIVADFYEHSDIELTERMRDIWPGFKPDSIAERFREKGFEKIEIMKISNDSPDNGNNKNKIDMFILTAVRK